MTSSSTMYCGRNNISIRFPIFFLLLFLSVPLHSFSKHKNHPSSWQLAIVELTAGQKIKGKVFIEHEVVGNYERHKNLDDVVEFRGNRIRGEQIFIYRQNRVQLYRPQEVSSVIILDQKQKPQRQFVTLPYKYHEENSSFYFFEVLVAGSSSLLKRTFRINGFGEIKLLYLLDETFQLQPCPTRRKEIMHKMGLTTKEVRKESWFNIMNTLGEEEVGNMVRLHNDLIDERQYSVITAE